MTTTLRSGRRLAWIYLIGGTVGLVAAFVLTLEKLEKLRNPDYVPTCSINPVLSCGSVMDSDQAEVFGFPNSLLGIAGFAVIVTVGVVMLAGFAPPRWFRLGAQLGTGLGVVFVHWLIYSSLYDIGALCPYCIVVWAVTIPIFWYTTIDTLLRAAHPGIREGGAVLTSLHTAIIAIWFALIAGLVAEAFWEYWVTLF